MAKPKFPSGTWVERDLFQSQAFLSLGGCAPQVLIIFLGKRIIRTAGRNGKQKRFCENCNSLKFSYLEAEKKYGISKPRFTRAIDQLLAKGFLHVVHRGGAYQMDKTVYSLVDNWRLWKPGQVKEKRDRDVPRGYQVKGKNMVTKNLVHIRAKGKR